MYNIVSLTKFTGCIQYSVFFLWMWQEDKRNATKTATPARIKFPIDVLFIFMVLMLSTQLIIPPPIFKLTSATHYSLSSIYLTNNQKKNSFQQNFYNIKYRQKWQQLIKN